MTRAIILIGFKACGKTSVGKVLAEQLSVPFIDTDELLLAHAAMDPTVSGPTSRGLTAGSIRTCADLYRLLGPDSFRALEKTVIHSLPITPAQVIATGGGVILDADNRRHLKQLGEVIYLAATYTTLRERLNTQPVPAFMGDDLDKHLQKLWVEREPLYRQTADRILNTDLLSIAQIATRLRGEDHGD